MIRNFDSPKEIWETLAKLFSKKNIARLQLLENELAMLTQGEEPISDARLRRYLIRGLRAEYMPFITSLQGWVNQPSIIDLENLLSNQEALAKQMSSKSISEPAEVLVSKGNSSEGRGYCSTFSSSPKKNTSGKPITCYRCGKTGHIR
ncbi:uncharacterized protein LOC122088178 isoform X2 [Macadamia integrifolia]|uniref:uncharacterized protein LOC122088178 isoform X2 n=1 Tax=Macadamia integrifolia TaxID=60698 RepID=UPI001C4FAD31|nr:uncharacterized protein LOC122088178 isoform X2 [Macadamia integrifolia]